MRKVGAALLFMVAGALLVLAWTSLDNLWADYQDSPDSLYLESAALWAVAALVFALLGVWVLRGR
jgi:hypothetical protein